MTASIIRQVLIDGGRWVCSFVYFGDASVDILMLVVKAAYEVYALGIALKRDTIAVAVYLAFLVTLRGYRLDKSR